MKAFPKALGMLPPMAELKTSTPSSSRAGVTRTQAKMADEDHDERMRRAITERALGPTQGRPLEAGERADMEHVLGQAFGDVRLHTDSPLAAQVAANALTIGSHVFFGPGLYVSGRPPSRALLAHELAHVAQNTRGVAPPGWHVSQPDDESELEATRVECAVARGEAPRGQTRAAPSAAIHRQPVPPQPAPQATPRPGAAPTPAPDLSAPIADYSREPRLEILNKVVNENMLYRRGNALLPWLERRVTTTPKFTRKELFDDKQATAGFDVPPAGPADLDPVLDLLVYHRVLERRPGQIGLDDKSNDPAFEVVAVTELIDENLAPEAYPDYRDPRSRMPLIKALHTKPFLAAMGQTAAIEQRMRARAPEAGLRDDARRRALKGPPKPTPLVETTAVTAAVSTGRGADRRFANSVIALFRRLRAVNAAWTAGQYAGHDYTEYSADIYLSGGVQGTQFFARAEASKFFDDLNDAAKDSDNADGFGRFAWRAVYNDELLQNAVNAKYGADRVISAPGHGPLGPRATAAGMKPPTQPVSVHIHLDLRPMDLSKDARLDYALDGKRVVPR